MAIRIKNIVIPPLGSASTTEDDKYRISKARIGQTTSISKIVYTNYNGATLSHWVVYEDGADGLFFTKTSVSGEYDVLNTSDGKIFAERQGA